MNRDAVVGWPKRVNFKYLFGVGFRDIAKMVGDTAAHAVARIIFQGLQDWKHWGWIGGERGDPHCLGLTRSHLEGIGAAPAPQATKRRQPRQRKTTKRRRIELRMHQQEVVRQAINRLCPTQILQWDTLLNRVGRGGDNLAF